MHKRLWLILLASVIAGSSASAQSPQGWALAGFCPRGYEFVLDRAIKHSGESSARVSRLQTTPWWASTATEQHIPADAYRGHRIRLQGWIRTEEIGGAGFWLRSDGPTSTLNLTNSGNHAPIRGTSDWVSSEVVMDVPQDAVTLAYGAWIVHGGVVWYDDLKLAIVSNDVATTPLVNLALFAPGSPPPAVEQPTNFSLEE